MDMGKGKRPKKGSVGTREGEREGRQEMFIFTPRKRQHKKKRYREEEID